MTSQTSKMSRRDFKRREDAPGRFRELGPNWDSYGAKPITEEAINAALDITAALAFVPISDGGIQVEVHAAGMDFEAEIGPDGKVRSLCWERA